MLRTLVKALLVSLLLSPAASAAITGIVMTADGQPIAGAKVSSFALETVEARRARLVSATPERTPLATTQTSSKGTFSLESPKEALVDVRIEAKGYAPETLRLERDEQAGAVAMLEAAPVSGTITAGGKPVAGATIVAVNSATAGDWVNEVIATTDASGRYSLPDPSKWASNLTFLHRDYALDVVMVRSTGKSGLDRQLSAGVPISGRVTKRSDDSPVADAALVVDGWPLAKSGADGSFTIAHAPKEWQALDAIAPGLIGTRARTAGTVLVKLDRAATVSGSLRDGRQQPIAGAEIRIGTRFRPASFSTLTDAKGNYSFAAVRSGDYEISGLRPGYSVTRASISIPAGARIARPMSAIPDARVSGTVTDDDKRPIAAAIVTVQPVARTEMPLPVRGATGPRVATGPDGSYVIRTSSEGDMTVNASKKGWPSGKSSAFKIASGDRKTGILVTIPRGTRVTGVVVDANGKALSGVGVTPAESQGGMGGRMVRMIIGAGMSTEDPVRTGSDGKFAVNVKEGTYDFAFRREGFALKMVRGIQVTRDTKPIEVTLEPGVEITGRVVRGGAGLENVNVTAFADGAGFTMTGPDGSFTIGDLTPGPVMLAISKNDAFVQTQKTITAPAKDVVIEVPVGTTVSGRVVDKSTHAPVTAFQAGLNQSRAGGGMVIQMLPTMHPFTSDDGSFKLENVPPGTARLVVSAPGYTTAEIPNLTIEEGKPLKDLEVALATGVRLAGRVTSTEGSPLSGVTVRPQRTDMMGGVMVMPDMGNNAVTDTQGEFSIDSLEPGEKTFSFSRAGYVTTQKTVALSGRETRVDVQLSSGQRVNGTVVSESGAPVPDIDVMATSATLTGGSRMTRTDATGAFNFEGLPPGHYTFAAGFQTRGSNLAQATVRDFDITSGAPVRLVMKSGAVVYGHVSGLSPAELQDATVWAYSSTAGGSSAAIDASGNYRIEGLPAGTIRVRADASNGLRDRRSSETKNVELPEGGSLQVDIEFPSVTVVRGRITRNGAPLGGARVNFSPRAGSTGSSASATADDAGNYSVTGLADASYNVAVIDTQRFGMFTTNYDVHGSGTFNIDVKGVDLRGTVTDGDTGEPIVNAQVNLRPVSQEGPMFGPAGGTDPSGNLLIQDVSPGTYTATAQKEGYGSVTRSNVVVTENGAEDLQFKMTKNDGVFVHVIDARDQRPLSANVTVYDANNEPMNQPMFRPDSSPAGVRLSLAPGQYRATVSAYGYASQNVTITSPSRPTVALTPGGTIVLHIGDGGTRRIRILDASGRPYGRSAFSRDGIFPVSGASTPLQNVAAGRYTIQIMGEGNTAGATRNAVVVEGGTVTVEL